MESVISERKNHYKAHTVWVVFGVSWGAVSYAYAGSVIGTTLGQPTFISFMKLDTAENAHALIGAITSLFYVGGVFGSFLAGWLSDKYGRKGAQIIASIVLVIGTACLAGSANVAMFIVFRFVVGAGAYMNYQTTPFWIAELVPPRGRSILAGIPGLLGVVGYIFAAYIGIGFYYYRGTNSVQWRVPLAIGCLPPIGFLLTSYWLPESPRWLLSHDRKEEAWNIVAELHSTDTDVDREYATAEFYQIQKQNELDKQLDSSWVALFRRPSYRKRVFIAFALHWILFSTGNLTVTTYAANIFSELGYNPAQSLHLLGGSYCAAIVGNLISLTYVDRIPRNVILSVGVLVCTVILSIHTALLAVYLPTGGKAGLSAAAAFIFLFLASFNLFLEGVSWYYIGEIFPTHLRSKGMALAAVAFCTVNILWLALAPTALANIGWKYNLVFISVSVPGSIFIYFYFPDTLGKPLEETAKLFGDDDLVALYSNDVQRDQVKGETTDIEMAEA